MTRPSSSPSRVRCGPMYGMASEPEYRRHEATAQEHGRLAATLSQIGFEVRDFAFDAPAPAAAPHPASHPAAETARAAAGAQRARQTDSRAQGRPRRAAAPTGSVAAAMDRAEPEGWDRAPRPESWFGPAHKGPESWQDPTLDKYWGSPEANPRDHDPIAIFRFAPAPASHQTYREQMRFMA